MDTNALAEQTRQKVEAGRQAAQELKEKGQEWAEKAKGTVRNAGAAADLYVHEYAWTSVVLIAAAAGVLGFLLGSNRR